MRFGILPITRNIQYQFDFWAPHEPPEPTLGDLSLKYDCFPVIDARN